MIKHGSEFFIESNKLSCPFCNKQLSLFARSFDNQIDLMNEYFYSYECVDCSILFQYPFWEKNQTSKFYPENYYAHNNSIKIPRNVRLLNSWLNKRFIYNYPLRILRLILYPYFEIIRDSKCVLDIGCGKGLFLDLMKSQNKDTYGIEPSTNAQSSAINKGHKIIDYDELTSYDNRFDLITMFQVAEHLSVDEILNENIFQKLNKALSKNGHLIIETPNYNCLMAKKYKHNWRALELPRHLIIFSPKSISKILEANGFKVNLFMRISPIDIVQSVKLKYSSKHFKIKMLTELINLFIHYKRNASLLTVVATKK